VLSLNVGGVRNVEWNGTPVATGIHKVSVSGRVALRGVNFEGDDQADRTVHGGPDKAVYAYAWEDYEFWKRAESFDVVPGLFGENLTTEGIDLSAAIIGERWRVGSTILEVRQPRLPCYKLGIRVGDPRFLKRFLRAARPGAYLSVVQEGDVGAGDAIEVLSTPTHGVSIRSMVEALHDPDRARSLGAVARLPKFWQQVADEAGGE
jgi:MOSC domain-containing protein YiiM